MRDKKIINIAVIAHVDAGKSTLVDAMLAQSGVFDGHEEIVDCVMDSNDIERERGITIYSKNCSINYKDYKINIVDTPGHADFSSEVERIIKTVDTAILLVDSSEGPMPQTRFVLQKSLERGLCPILLINKIDKKDERAEEVVNMTFDLFAELGAHDEQLDFPILYGVAREGIVRYDMEDTNEDITPLFETICKHVVPFPDKDDEPLQLQISALAYDDYIGRLGIGRVLSGTIHPGDMVSVAKRDGSIVKGKIGKTFVNIGLARTEQDEVHTGDIVTISGLSDISIGETIGNDDNLVPLPMIIIEEPTLSMNFYVNNSPFQGRSGKFVTTRHIKARLEKELETNVGLKVEEIEGTDAFKVSGRGELHLSILLENMRRESYELSVSKPQVLIHETEHGKQEPFERVNITAPDAYIGAVISKLNVRKGMMEHMHAENGFTKIEYIVPTRGLLGYRSDFINDTRGEGIMVRSFDSYQKFVGEIPSRINGVLISQELGTTMAYSLFNLSDRGKMFIGSAVEVYEGMIIGLNNRSDDMVVNPCKNKKMTNTRSSGADESLKLTKPQEFNLEEALEFIEEDEWVEVTPDAIRLRKRVLNTSERNRSNKGRA
jgi:GTP-binding protein